LPVTGNCRDRRPVCGHENVVVAQNSCLLGTLYGLAEVDEYWIVNHVDGVVEVYRDRDQGEWRTVSLHRRGETIAMLQFPDVVIAVSEILPPV